MKKTIKQMRSMVDSLIDEPMMLHKNGMPQYNNPPPPPDRKWIYKEHYSLFWDRVKHAVDNEGWVCSKRVDHILDSHFEQYLNRSVEFKDNTPKDDGYKWRPKSIGEQLTLNVSQNNDHVYFE